jgi:hypothetical protein
MAFERVENENDDQLNSAQSYAERVKATWEWSTKNVDSSVSVIRKS